MGKRGKAKDPYRYLCPFERRTIYIVLEDLRLDFTPRELKTLFFYWSEGFSIFYISQVLNRDVDEIAALILDLAEREKSFITSRDRGIFISSPITDVEKQERSLEKFLKKNPSGYAAFQDFCEEVDFIWDEQDVIKFERYWRNGYSITLISKTMNRNILEVALLIIDRSRKGLIFPRPGGLNGVDNLSKKACS